MSLEKFIQHKRSAFDTETPRAEIWEHIRQALTAGDTDPLAQFVAENRLAFDEEAPPAGLLDRIQTKQSDQSAALRRLVAHRPSWWLQAAVVLILIGAALLGGRLLGYQAAQEDYLAVISKIQPDFPEAEAYYRQNIEALSTVVYKHHPDPRLIADFAEMDRAIEELRQEIPQVPQQQQARIVADLIRTYRIKLEILQNLLASLPEETEANYQIQAYENDEI